VDIHNIAGDTQAVLSFPSAANLTNINDLDGLAVSEIDFTAEGNYALSGKPITLVQGPSGVLRIHMGLDAQGHNNTIALDLGRVRRVKGQFTRHKARDLRKNGFRMIQGGPPVSLISRTGRVTVAATSLPASARETSRL
jgi:hypothetical protein